MQLLSDGHKVEDTFVAFYSARKKNTEPAIAIRHQRWFKTTFSIEGSRLNNRPGRRAGECFDLSATFRRNNDRRRWPSPPEPAVQPLQQSFPQAAGALSSRP